MPQKSTYRCAFLFHVHVKLKLSHGRCGKALTVQNGKSGLGEVLVDTSSNCLQDRQHFPTHFHIWLWRNQKRLSRRPRTLEENGHFMLQVKWTQFLPMMMMTGDSHTAVYLVTPQVQRLKENPVNRSCFSTNEIDLLTTNVHRTELETRCGPKG